MREIEDICQGANPEHKILDNIEFEWPDSEADFLAMLQFHEASPPEGQVSQVDHIWISRPIIRSGEKELHQQVHEPSAKQWFEDKTAQQLCSIFVKLFTLRLDGRTRFDLVDPKATGPLEMHPKNHLWALFVNDGGREKVREFTEEAFRKHFVIDPTGMMTFRVRLSAVKPENKAIEQGLDEKSRDFHKSAPLVSDLGDGLRTSIGLVSAVMSLPHRILLVDEPEAFLHPTLARRVGTVLASTARERDASLIVATHSPDFLMGCMQSAPELRIVRLTYFDDQPTARSVEPSEITKLMRNPLLRSTNALRALFHRGVIITEADADRAFYEEINTRLLEKARGIDSALFLNAQNWQTVSKIATPLRKLGIPACAVLDFDVLLSDNWNDLWNLVVGADKAELQSARGRVKTILESVGKDDCKARGIACVPAESRETVQQFMSNLAAHGVFIVPIGELECWLSSLDIDRTNNKPLWLTSIFERLGDDPAADDYVEAGNDDVWDFISQIENWIGDPDRKGIPE